MKAIFVLLSVLAAVLFASAVKVTQSGNTLVVSAMKGRPGQSAKLLFRDAATATKNLVPLTNAFVKRGY